MLKTLGFNVSMVIKSHTSRSTKVKFSLIGHRCYELQSKLCLCYPKIIYKIVFRFRFCPRSSTSSVLSFCDVVVRAVKHYLIMPEFKLFLS